MFTTPRLVAIALCAALNFAIGIIVYLVKLPIYLDSVGTGDLSDQIVRRAMTYGSVLASFNVEQFGTERVQVLTEGEINRRFEEFRLMTHVDAQPVALRSSG